jgi:soluble lytic murein transglycosylase-like protein
MILAPAWALADDIYRFVDRDGVAHYTNVKPAGRGWQRVFRGSRKRSPAQSLRAELGRLDRDPNAHRRYDTHIREAALLYQLPDSIIRAVLKVESNFYPYVVSADGAMGLMQLMPATAANMGVRNPFDPRENILGGARFLRILANSFNGDLVLTLAAYNAGPAAVVKYRGVPPYAETRRYVRNVLRYYYAYRSER